MAAQLPDHLSADRHRSLEGRRKAVILRRLAVAGLSAVLLAGLIGAFGQGVRTVVARGSTATLTVSAPERVPVVSLHHLRPILEGEPIVLIEHGRVLDRNLRRERMTVDELAAEARLNQIASLATVEWAVLETGGAISSIEMAQQRE